jgi:hypothetical protein
LGTLYNEDDFQTMLLLDLPINKLVEVWHMITR